MSKSIQRRVLPPVIAGFLLGVVGGGLVKAMQSSPDVVVNVAPPATPAPTCEPVLVEVEKVVPPAGDPRFVEIPIRGGGECVRVADGVNAVLRIETPTDPTEEPCVAQLDERRWAVLPQVLEADSSCAPRRAKIVPSFRDGHADGFKVYGVRAGSLYADLGLENGDVVRRINGMEIATPDQALEVYAQLQELTTFSVEIHRRGEDRVHFYEIVE